MVKRIKLLHINLVFVLFLFLTGCGEVRRLRTISNQSDYRDVSQTIESILWNAEQAAIRGERFITYPVKPEDNVSEICRVIKRVDYRFKIERHTEENCITLVIKW